MNASRVFCIGVLITGCASPSRDLAFPKLTPEDAKAALITLATDNPNAFADFPPDPELLKSLPIRPLEDGTLGFGAFTIDTERLWYSADIEWRGGMHSYNGDFVYVDGRWFAEPPELMRFHNPR